MPHFWEMHIHSTWDLLELVSEGIPIAWKGLLVPVKKGIQMLRLSRKVFCLFKTASIFLSQHIM